MFFRNGTYDPLGRISSGTLTSGSTTVYAFTSGWQGAQLQNSYDKVLGQTSTYTYDGFNRLLSRTANGVQDYTWTYDRYGNRWTQNGAGQNFNTATNQLSTGGYTYDAAGNMTYDSFNHYTYTYDAEGNITAVTGNTTATYVYNALNQRVRTVASGATTEFVFNAGGQRVSEWNGARAQLKGKYYWGGKPVAYYTTASSGSAGTHFEHTDWLGTERTRTTYNSGGNPQYAVEGGAGFTSLPWGDAQTPATNGSDAAHYAQLDHDAETNTDHADFRQYSDAQGRWLSPDPYDGSYDGSNPQSMNRYSYAADSPLSYVDPSGLDTIQVPCGVHIWYVIEDYQMKILWWDTIYCSIDTGNSGNSENSAPNNGTPQQPSCSQQASAAANNNVPSVLPHGWDVADGIAGGAIGLGVAVATAPEDGPLAGGVYSVVSKAATGVIGGLLKTSAFHAVAKAFVYGVSYSNCVTPSSAPYFSAP